MVFFHPIIAYIIGKILAILLVFSGILKVSDLKKFYLTIVKYGILKGKLAKLFGYSYPFVEILLGILLWMSFPKSIAVYFAGIASLLFLTMLIAVAFALIKNKKINNCGCYGEWIKVPISKKKLIENIFWFLLALYYLLAFLLPGVF